MLNLIVLASFYGLNLFEQNRPVAQNQNANAANENALNENADPVPAQIGADQENAVPQRIVRRRGTYPGGSVFDAESQTCEFGSDFLPKHQTYRFVQNETENQNETMIQPTKIKLKLLLETKRLSRSLKALINWRTVFQITSKVSNRPSTSLKPTKLSKMPSPVHRTSFIATYKVLTLLVHRNHRILSLEWVHKSFDPFHDDRPTNFS